MTAAGEPGIGLHVIGTAGHVDHGKTALIEALTGIDTDRLPEEKRRGLTIDLGFAHFFTPEGKPIGVIDVPGHERFLRNMVAGAWALDLALLTVAVDDGWMQQSSDHTRVLQLMDVPRLIAVITKADLASPERLREVMEQAAAECSRRGYASAPTIAVSALKRTGIEELKALILRELEALEQTAAGRQRPVPAAVGNGHLYVDRAFSVKGAGVVITGTLKGGALERGQELLLLPRNTRVRMRGLQTYHLDAQRVEATSRVALNLSGIDSGQIGRGDLLTDQGGSFRVVNEFIARAPAAALKRDSEVEIAVGTGHQIVRLSHLPEGNLLRIRSSRGIALSWNQPIVLIQHGGSTILGGGRVLWLGGTSKQQRLRLAEIESILPPRLAEEHLARLKLHLEGAVAPQEGKSLELSADLAQSTVVLEKWVLTREYRDLLEKRIRELSSAPGGVRIDELATKMRSEPEAPVRLVARSLADAGILLLRGGILLPAGAQAPQVSPMGRQLLRDLRAAGTRGLELSKLKVSGARKELRNLVRTDLAVALEGEIYYEKEIYRGLVQSCLAGLEVGGTLTIAEAKNRTELSRKYIIPLLNRMESEGLVKRSGDQRIVTAKPG